MQTQLRIIIDKIVGEMAGRIMTEGSSVVMPGNNGPYYDKETNVRNLAHWCVIFSEYYLNTKSEKYKRLVQILGDAILASPEYNGNGVYKCRELIKSDEVNGVIGPAWIIEGLIYASKVTGDDKYYERAALIFEVIPFNNRLGIWKRINTENQEMSLDITFNHQLWLAAAGAMICSYKDNELIASRVDRFVNRLSKNIVIRGNGRIAHFGPNDTNGIISYFARIYRDIKSDLCELINKPSMAYKESGYHCFNLYGFAVLKDYYKGDIVFLNSKKFKKALAYAVSDSSFMQLTTANKALDATKVKTKLNVDFNIFSYAYNSSAFELPRICESFDIKDKSMIMKYEEKQIELTYCEETGLFSKNVDDVNTINARIYEYIAGNGNYWSK